MRYDMEKNKIIDIFNLVKDILPKEASELFLSFDGFSNHFKMIIEQLKLISQEKLDNNEFDEEYLSLSNNLNKLYIFYKNLQDINLMFLLDENLQNSISDTELKTDDIEIDKETILDDTTDIVKYSKIHYLDENFDAKTPAGFIFKNNDFVVTPTWTSLYKKLCLILLDEDRENFYELINILNDKKVVLAQDKSNLFMPIKLASDLYLEANLPTFEFINILKSIFSIYNIPLDQLKIYLENEEIMEEIEESENINSETIKIATNGYIESVKVNYSDYQVNRNEEHYLYENFEHKKICGYILKGFDYSNIDTWANMYVEICNKLISLDSTKFINIQNWFKGLRPYVSFDKTKLRKARRLTNNLYLETNQSANHITSNIGKLLQYYNFSKNDLKLYLRADYTDLHKD